MSSWRLELTGAARRNLRALPVRERERIEQALERFLDNPWRADLQKLKGVEATWRLRVGDYRVTLGFDRDNQLITVYRIAHRRESYR